MKAKTTRLTRLDILDEVRLITYISFTLKVRKLRGKIQTYAPRPLENGFTTLRHSELAI